MNEEKKKPSLSLSIIGVAGLIVILLIGILVYKINIVLLLLIGILYITIVAKFNNLTFNDILDGMKEGCSQAFVGLLFFLLIGGIIGTWVQCGTVPVLVYYGLKILNPKYFLITSFFICSIVSALLGTSWGTIGTVGIAVMGVAVSSGLSIPLYVVAGSIVAGAWFGDKMSPISDSTVLTATACDSEVYRHIKAMCYTTLPSYAISTVIFILINSHYASSSTLNTNSIMEIQTVLLDNFTINFWVLLPAIVLVILCILKINAILSLFSVIGVGIVTSVIVQGNSVPSAFDAVMCGVQKETSLEAVNVLLNRGGIESMMPTFLLGFTALCLGGALQKTGFFMVIVEKLASRLKSVFSLVFITMITCITGNAIFGDTYLTIVLNANMYKEIYKRKGLDSSMLSRTIEEAATMSTPLIPWTAAGAFITGALGIPTSQYAMFAVLNLVNPVVSLICAYTGFGIIKNKND